MADGAETRSERAKRLRAEGKFLPKNPGRPRRVRDENEIRRQSLMSIIESGTARQKLDAAKQLEALDEAARAAGPVRRNFDQMTEQERDDHLESVVLRLCDQWYSDRMLPKLRFEFEKRGLGNFFDDVYERNAA